VADVFSDDDKCFVASGPRQFSGLRRGIEIRNLWFSYTEGTPVLRGLSCLLTAGRTTALVGATGCGKTTVANIIARLYECPPGSVLLDGHDIRQFSRESLANRIAVVGQESWLFNDSVRANLVIGLDRPVADDELVTLLDRVKLTDVVARMPQGLDAEIGDAGLKLSGGEKQRLSIARALLRQADLLLLDEATASLDSQTEREVLDALQAETRGCTVISIAHRLSTVRHADKIVVLSHGRVVEEGSWSQLIHRHGVFAALWQAQTQQGGDEPLALEAEGAAS